MRWREAMWGWLDRLEERRAARAYGRRLDKAKRQWRESDRYAQIKACEHKNREPSPEATSAYARGWNPQTCLDCGIGILTIPRT